MDDATDALEDVNVVEFTQFTAGPAIGKWLANFGATIARVESSLRPDGGRIRYPPFWEGEKGINRSGAYAIFNDGKYGINLNLKTDEGIELARELATWADVVIENFRPGVIDRLGLGYETLSELNPELVMLSSSNQGQFGPHADHPGYGTQLTSLAGFTHFTGYSEDTTPQVLVNGPYTDVLGVGFGFVALLAALAEQERTGQGQYIDIAQYEVGLQVLGPALLAHSVSGENLSRRGNKSPDAAPHDAYPCEDGWCVVSVHDDDEWTRLCEAMDDDLADDDRFDTHAKRKENESMLDDRIAAWTEQFTVEELVTGLQEVGVHAGRVNTMADLIDDPQLDARNVWWEIEHSEIGEHTYESPPFELSKTPSGPGLPAPCLGEHNEEFYVDIFGMSPERFERLVDEEVIY